MLLYSKITY